jgi:hypothetical protein
MRRSYSAAPLSADEIGPAFAMVQAIYPRTDLDTWSAFARLLIGSSASEERAIIGMRSENGYLCGLFAYRVEADFEYERALVVDAIAVLDLIDPGSAMRFMVSEIEGAGARLGCGATYLHVRGTHGALRHHLVGLGYVPEARILRKSGTFFRRD